MRKAQTQAVLGPVVAARQHHLTHPVGTDNAAHAHCRPAADKDTAPPLGQLEPHRRLCNAHMRRGGNFQTAANHRPRHRGDNRQTAVFDQVCHAVPVARMVNRFFGAAVFMFGQVQTRAEMATLTVQDDRAHAFGRMGKELVQRRHQRIVHGIALVRAVKDYGCDVVFDLDAGHVCLGCVFGHENPLPVKKC